jgi:hypothetical protein
MNLEDFLYSIIGIDKNVAVVNDVKSFKKSIDNSINNNNDILNYDNIKIELDDCVQEDNVVIKQEFNEEGLFKNKEKIPEIITEKTSIIEVNNISIPCVNNSIEIKLEPIQALEDISNKIPIELKDKEHNQPKKKENFKLENKKPESKIIHIENIDNINNISKLNENTLEHLKSLYRELRHHIHPFSNSEYIQLSKKFLNIFDNLSYKNNRQINLVLDIDNTLLYALEETKMKVKSKYSINFTVDKKKFTFSLALRKGLGTFFQDLRDISNFYINTHGMRVYADEIVKFLNSEYNLNITSNKVIARDDYFAKRMAGSKYLHIYSHLHNDEAIANFYRNAIALDDKPEVWSPVMSRCPVLNSKKFINFYDLFMPQQYNAVAAEIFPYCLLVNNKNTCNLLELNKEYKDKIRLNDVGFVHVENELSKFSQLEYFTAFIKKVHKFINLLGCKNCFLF